MGLLRRFYLGRSTDPPDKIYALLGLVIEWSEEARILPDYTVSTRDVYEKIVIYSIWANSNLASRLGSHGRHSMYVPEVP